MSCGDLDGDNYLIIWERDIVKNTHPQNPNELEESNSKKPAYHSL